MTYECVPANQQGRSTSCNFNAWRKVTKFNQQKSDKILIETRWHDFLRDEARYSLYLSKDSRLETRFDYGIRYLLGTSQRSHSYVQSIWTRYLQTNKIHGRKKIGKRLTTVVWSSYLSILNNFSIQFEVIEIGAIFFSLYVDEMLNAEDWFEQ